MVIFDPLTYKQGEWSEWSKQVEHVQICPEYVFNAYNLPKSVTSKNQIIIA